MIRATHTTPAWRPAEDRWPKPPDETPRPIPVEVPIVPEKVPGPVPEIPVTPAEVPGPVPSEVPEPGERTRRGGPRAGA